MNTLDVFRVLTIDLVIHQRGFHASAGGSGKSEGPG